MWICKTPDCKNEHLHLVINEYFKHEEEITNNQQPSNLEEIYQEDDDFYKFGIENNTPDDTKKSDTIDESTLNELNCCEHFILGKYQDDSFLFNEYNTTINCVKQKKCLEALCIVVDKVINLNPTMPTVLYRGISLNLTQHSFNVGNTYTVPLTTMASCADTIDSAFWFALADIQNQNEPIVFEINNIKSAANISKYLPPDGAGSKKIEYLFKPESTFKIILAEFIAIPLSSQKYGRTQYYHVIMKEI